MKVVNIFGGPCTGKSTLAAGLFYSLKSKGVSCELASEWIKAKVYEGNSYVQHDQLYVFAKQRKLLKQLEGKVDIVICDSPLLLSLIYGKENTKEFQRLIVSEFRKFNNINFVLQRKFSWKSEGRYGDEDNAKKIDKEVLQILQRTHTKYTTIDGLDIAKLYLELHCNSETRRNKE